MNSNRGSPQASSQDGGFEEAAIAAAAALVGENLVDSPTQRPKPTVDMDLTTTTTAEEQQIGIVASGLAWVQRQREMRQRQYLQNQVESQVRRIQEKIQADQANQTVPPSSLQHNPTFRANTNAPVLSSMSESASDGSRTPPPCQISSSTISKSGKGISVQVQFPALSDDPLSSEWTPNVRTEPERKEAPPFILTREQMKQISMQALPRTIAECRWKRVYSLLRDGDSFDMCLGRLAGEAKTLLVVKTTRGRIFGAYADAPWASQPNPVYYGSAQACLFTWWQPDSGDSDDVVVYRWTGANRYIQLCDASKKLLAMGGGNGVFGLNVSQDFQIGSTGACETFGNEPLDEQEHFNILDLEIWGFLTGQF